MKKCPKENILGHIQFTPYNKDNSIDLNKLKKNLEEKILATRSDHFNFNGIKASDHNNCREFYFYTDNQGEVENAMTLMGYSSSDYYLNFFYNRPQETCRYCKSIKCDKENNLSCKFECLK